MFLENVRVDYGSDVGLDVGFGAEVGAWMCRTKWHGLTNLKLS
jgi:hypothetical protein